jgi:hypothetical protein
MSTYLTFRYGNVIKMKNTPDPALFRSSYLSNEIKKWISKSFQTIPLIHPGTSEHRNKIIYQKEGSFVPKEVKNLSHELYKKTAKSRQTIPLKQCCGAASFLCGSGSG